MFDVIIVGLGRLRRSPGWKPFEIAIIISHRREDVAVTYFTQVVLLVGTWVGLSYTYAWFDAIAAGYRPFVFALIAAVAFCAVSMLAAAVMSWMPRIKMSNVIGGLVGGFIAAALIILLPKYWPGVVEIIPRRYSTRNPLDLVAFLSALGYFGDKEGK